MAVNGKIQRFINITIMHLYRGIPSDKRNRKLLREIKKIEGNERTDIRMIETIRHRFRSRLKKYEVPRLSSGSDAVDVRMYDTHNPGFCYHCTGAIRAGDKRPRRISTDLYDAVHSMLFTDGEVDPDKVLCLHVLTAHCPDSRSGELSNIGRAASFTDEGKQQRFGGAWNNILPCYVVELERNVDEVTDFSDEVKRHKDPMLTDAENELVEDFQEKYEKYLAENPDVGMALAANQKLTTMVPNDIGKLTIIPPHVYSLLGAAQELKIKQAIAEESRRKRFRRGSSSVVKNVDDQSISFRLDDDEDEISRRVMTATSIRGWTTQRFAGTSRISAFQSLSRKSATSSRRTDPSITTLKRASPDSSGMPLLSMDLPEAAPQIVTIKPSNQALSSRVSKTSSTKSPFQNFPSTLGPLSPCSNSILSGVAGPLGQPRKIRRPIFVNYPTTSIELRNKEYEAVPILVNNQMQALVHTVMDVLERVNPAKMRKIVATASSLLEIRKMLIRPDIQAFVESLAGQPLVSSPSSFVTSMASTLYEIDPRIESSIEKELVAKTLPVPPAPAWHRLVEEIRNNLFVDPNAVSGKGARVKVESFRSQRQKLLESRPCKGSCEEKDVFDVDNSCPHSDVEGNRMTCACCYAKWKGSLPDTEQSGFPDFSFLDDNESELTPENAAKSKSNLLEVTTASHEDKKQGKHKHGNYEKKKKLHGISDPFVKDSKSGNTARALIVQTATMTNDMKLLTLKPESKTIVSSDQSTDPFLGKSEYPHSSRSKPSKRAARAMGLKASKRALSMKVGQQPRNSSYPIDRSSRLSRKASVKKFADKSIRAKAKPFVARTSFDQIEQKESYEGSSSFSSLNTESMNSGRPKKPDSKIALRDDESSPMCQFKPWKASHDPGYLDPDRIILRRMTNPQRILVGQMCASLKTRKTNMEGLVREKTPLAALIAPVFSDESIKILTKGIRGVGSRKREVAQENDEGVAIASEKLTGPVLARVRQAVAENETQRKLQSFLKSQL